MERKLARIERILALDPIPGADKIEVATVGGWKVVVKKGLYQIGDGAMFFEIDSLLPHRPWSAFLFKDTRELYRLKTVKLRGQISQGLLVPLDEIPETSESWHVTAELYGLDPDFTKILGISKWEPNIPANLAGQVKGSFPHFLRKTDEIRLQSAKGVLDEIKDIPVYVAVKMDGTSFTAYRHEGVFGVCSRNLELREEGGDDYWAAAKAARLHETLPENYSISAELCGPGIQGNKMGLTQKTLYVFNVWNIKEQKYLNYLDFVTFVEKLQLQIVPMVTHLANSVDLDTIDQWLAFVDTVKYSNDTQAEGVVVRPLIERYSPTLDGRLSFKIISNNFLLKTGE